MARRAGDDTTHVHAARLRLGAVIADDSTGTPRSRAVTSPAIARDDDAGIAAGEIDSNRAVDGRIAAPAESGDRRERAVEVERDERAIVSEGREDRLVPAARIGFSAARVLIRFQHRGCYHPAVRLEDLGLIGNCQCAALVDRRARSSGAACRASTPSRCSELLDPDGGRFLVGAGRRRRARSATSTTRTCWRRRSTRRAGASACSTSRRASSSTTACSGPRSSCASSSRSTARRASSCAASRARLVESAPRAVYGSHHIGYDGYASELRLTTDLPLSYLDGQPFALTARHGLVLAWGAPIEEPLVPLCDRFFAETVRHWQRWVKHCDIPPLYQHEVIRSALALKLHCFEDTGAIVAAMTTSIPESRRQRPHLGLPLLLAARRVLRRRRVPAARPLRGARAVRARTCSTSPAAARTWRSRRSTASAGGADLEERIAPNWAGWNGDGPVRVGNGAAFHVQHDIFGEMVLALAPIFLDERFSAERSPATLDLLVRLARRAIAVAGPPDAGIWEYRTAPQAADFSSLMCWAAADRAADRRRARRAGRGRGVPDAAARDPRRDRRSARGTRSSALRRRLRRRRPRCVAAADGAAALLPGRRPAAARHDRRDLEGAARRMAGSCATATTTASASHRGVHPLHVLAGRSARAVGRGDEARALMDAADDIVSPLGLLSEDYDTVQRSCGATSRRPTRTSA